jgi:hypothetical protein
MHSYFGVCLTEGAIERGASSHNIWHYSNCRSTMCSTLMLIQSVDSSTWHYGVLLTAWSFKAAAAPC